MGIHLYKTLRFVVIKNSKHLRNIGVGMQTEAFGRVNERQSLDVLTVLVNSLTARNLIACLVSKI